jgi:hypothetical protein
MIRLQIHANCSPRRGGSFDFSDDVRAMGAGGGEPGEKGPAVSRVLSGFGQPALRKHLSGLRHFLFLLLYDPAQEIRFHRFISLVPFVHVKGSAAFHGGERITRGASKPHIQVLCRFLNAAMEGGATVNVWGHAQAFSLVKRMSASSFAAAFFSSIEDSAS